MSKAEFIASRVEHDMKAQLSTEAAERGQTLSDYVHDILASRHADQARARYLGGWNRVQRAAETLNSAAEYTRKALDRTNVQWAAQTLISAAEFTRKALADIVGSRLRLTRASDVEPKETV